MDYNAGATAMLMMPVMIQSYEPYGTRSRSVICGQGIAWSTYRVERGNLYRRALNSNILPYFMPVGKD
jgi:hypothetical protein